MKRIGMGIVGAGFVGPHHVDAVRRLGYVDVVAIAGSSDASARKKADALGIERSYGSYEALLDDPDVQVVHNATPNYLHYPVNAAALAKGKHVVSDKPLAMTAAEARTLLDQATKAGVVHAVTFNYRGNPLVQQARHAIARGDIGRPHFLVGHYLQDWLLKDTDYSWRLEPDKGGASSALGDIGSHWCDLAQHVSGLRITHVLGDITTVIPKRKRPKGVARSVPDRRRRRGVRSGGHRGRGPGVGAAAVRQRRQGRVLGRPGLLRPQERPVLEVCGSKTSLRWTQEQQNELWIGHRDKANEILQKDPVAARRGGARLRAPARRPPGGLGRCVLQPDARHLRLHRRRPEADRRAPARVRHVRRRLPRQLHRRGDSREREGRAACGRK